MSGENKIIKQQTNLLERQLSQTETKANDMEKVVEGHEKMITRMSTMQKEEKNKNQEFVKKITLKAKQVKELNTQVTQLKT